MKTLITLLGREKFQDVVEQTREWAKTHPLKDMLKEGQKMESRTIKVTKTEEKQIETDAGHKEVYVVKFETPKGDLKGSMQFDNDPMMSVGNTMTLTLKSTQTKLGGAKK